MNEKEGREPEPSIAKQLEQLKERLDRIEKFLGRWLPQSDASAGEAGGQ